MITFVLTCVFGLSVLLYFSLKKRPKNYPPGPPSFHLLGNLIQMLVARRKYGKNQGLSTIFEIYRKKYGKIFSFDFIWHRAVVINDHQMIKELWNNPQMTGRPKLHASHARTGGVLRGILFQDGNEWSEQRRFALRNLRDFGFGKKSMETVIMDEVVDLVERIRKETGKPISTQNRFNIAVLNSLWTIVGGERYSQDDPEVVKIIESISRSLSMGGLVLLLPFLKKIAPKLSGWEAIVNNLMEPYNFMNKFVKQRLSAFDNNSEPENFTDVYINEIRRTTDTNSSFYKERGEATLVATLLDLFVAGAETTSTTLTYIFLYLALFPEKQEKLHEEIDRVLGSRLATLADRINMPYTEAVIHETLRYSSMVPRGISHKALEDTYIQGYFIPKDTWLSPNLRAVHHDANLWGDPENFRPERFLSATGEEVIRHEAFLPFSFGKRVCLGESLARDELFLFTTSLFQQFVVQCDPNGPRPTTEQIYITVISSPLPHKLILKERNPLS